MNKKITLAVLTAVCLAFFVVALGAYTRLTDAGLGCPDWPGCYGHINVSETYFKAKTDSSIEPTKALTEMVHRYFAGTLGLLILAFAFIAIRAKAKKEDFPFLLPLVLVALVVFQAMLGMWTVTLKLLPVVVMSHLLGGLSILSCLWWLYLTLNHKVSFNSNNSLKFLAKMGLGFTAIQIALGGWVSSNYAGISCVGFPFCNGELLPHLDFSHAFNVLSPIGENYQGGMLDITSRITIQMVHRIGAVITASFVIFLSVILLRQQDVRLKRIAKITLLVVITQFSLGVVNVVYILPLKAAVMHNAVGALLLLCMLTITHATSRGAK